MAGLGAITAEAKHINREEVEALEQECFKMEEPIFDRMREKEITTCVETAKNNRTDPEKCARFYRDIVPGGHIYLTPQFPVCEEAYKARKHLRLYPK